MYRLIAENEYGDEIVLHGREDKWQILSVEGVDPPKANVNISSVAGMDGGLFMSSRLESRNIVLMLKLNGNVEANRLELYRIFKSKRYVKLKFSNESLSVFSEGYVDNIECSLFSMAETMQISVICPDPYFKGIGEGASEISILKDGFSFPFAIESEGIAFSVILEEAEAVIVNDGESDTGMNIIIDITGTVVNPVITNTWTEEYLGVGGSFTNGDRIIIDTSRGKKKISLLRAGSESSLVMALTSGSDWLQLASGVNRLVFTAEAGTDNAIINVSYRVLYEAV